MLPFIVTKQVVKYKTLDFICIDILITISIINVLSAISIICSFLCTYKHCCNGDIGEFGRAILAYYALGEWRKIFLAFDNELLWSTFKVATKMKKTTISSCGKHANHKLLYDDFPLIMTTVTSLTKSSKSRKQHIERLLGDFFKRHL